MTLHRHSFGAHDLLVAVARYYRLDVADLKGAKRHQPLAQRRQLAMYLARLLTTMSYPVIGKVFGGRDHTTVMYGCRVVSSRLAVDPELAQDAQAICEYLDRLRQGSCYDRGFLAKLHLAIGHGRSDPPTCCSLPSEFALDQCV
jgi:hypothetical protein